MSRCTLTARGLDLELDGWGRRMVDRDGWIEAELLDLVWDFVPEDTSLVDVGAHCGLWSLYWFLDGREGRVTSVDAFEPWPENARSLRRNVERNGLQDSVTVHEVAISDKPGRQHISLVSQWRLLPQAPAGAKSFEVPVHTLDEFDLYPIGLLKIDVEGLEAEVLRGADDLIALSRPIIVTEWEENQEKIQAEMDRLEYRRELTWTDDHRPIRYIVWGSA